MQEKNNNVVTILVVVVVLLVGFMIFNGMSSNKQETVQDQSAAAGGNGGGQGGGGQGGSGQGGGGSNTGAPTATITSPVSGSSLSKMFYLEFTATDNKGWTYNALVPGVPAARFYATDSSGVTSEIGQGQFMVLNGAKSTYGNLLWNTATSGHANGTYSVFMKVWDNDGLMGTSAPITLTLVNGAVVTDTQAPAIYSAINPPKCNAVYPTCGFNFRTYDNVGATEVKLYEVGSSGALTQITPNPNSYSSLNVDGSYIFYWSVTGVSSGNHNMVAKAKDAAGNVGSYSFTLNIPNY